MGGRPPYVPPPKPKPQPTRPSTRGLGRAAIPFIPKKDGGTTNNGGTTKDLVKPSETSNFVEKVQETKADLSIEERLAFMSLTGTEILEISRNFNMSNNSLSLNKNILDSVIVVNEVNPMQLIKMQETNNSISSNFPKTVEDTKVEISKVTGNSTISAPAPTVVQTQIKVEVHTPRAVFAWGML
jgi:hypothetical protein